MPERVKQRCWSSTTAPLGLYHIYPGIYTQVFIQYYRSGATYYNRWVVLVSCYLRISSPNMTGGARKLRQLNKGLHIVDGRVRFPAWLSRSAALELMPWTPLRDAPPPSVFAETARTQVRVYALSPQSGPAGTAVTVAGFGFTNDNAIHFGNRVVTHAMIRSAFGVSCTVAPSCQGGVRELLVFKVPAAPPGKYRVSVENSNGNSNELSFSVN